MEIGLGWHVLTRAGRQIANHNGQTGGYHAFLGVDPSRGAKLLVLANSATNIDDIGLHLIDPGLPLKHPGPR